MVQATLTSFNDTLVCKYTSVLFTMVVDTGPFQYVHAWSNTDPYLPHNIWHVQGMNACSKGRCLY